MKIIDVLTAAATALLLSQVLHGAQLTVNLGAGPNDKTGETLRTGGGKINTNFTELYATVFTNGVSVATNLVIAGGTTIKKTLSQTAVLDFPSISAQASATLTITITNAVIGDAVFLGLPASPNSQIVFNAFISAQDTVTIRAFNISTGAVDPASATYRAVVFGF